MAPKKDTKRQQEAKTSASAATKKPRIDAPKKARSDPALDAVAEAIQQLQGLTDSCRQMLLIALPGSLGIPADERHESQKMVVEMIGDALQSIDASLQAAVEVDAAKVVAIESSKSVLEENLISKQLILKTATELVHSNKLELAESAKMLAAAKSTLAEKQEAQRTGDAACAAAKDSKAAIDKAIEVELKAILEGSCDDAQLKLYYESLTPILRTVSLEDSLVTALPTTCAKAKANRGAFDQMVLEQLEKSVAEKAAELAKILDEAASSTQARLSAVEAAEGEQAATSDKQKNVGEALASSMASEKEASAAVDIARAALSSYEVDCSSAVDARDATARVADQFREHKVRSFELLRDKVAAQPVDATKLGAVADIVSKPDVPCAAGGA